MIYATSPRQFANQRGPLHNEAAALLCCRDYDRNGSWKFGGSGWKRTEMEWPQQADTAMRSVRSVLAVFCLSIGGAAGCPKDAGEEDRDDNRHDNERGSNHG
jgi:hypothetical protein